jgi:hypothetical protein
METGHERGLVHHDGHRWRDEPEFAQGNAREDRAILTDDDNRNLVSSEFGFGCLEVWEDPGKPNAISGPDHSSQLSPSRCFSRDNRGRNGRLPRARGALMFGNYVCRRAPG